MKKSKRRFRRKVKNFVLKTITFLNFMSLIYWVCLIDAVISWQPYAIMAANLAWLVLFGYANRYFDTEKEVEDETEEENVCVIPVDFSHGSGRENRHNGRNRKIM